ncbi:response regulator transcription factor [Kurthia sibirica]|uniref:Heme response regulator HssR n=1 Tax=Kurthia sibirica TaxID=202750 RepID=A0A2U3AKP1_9BACL|nr:response regulator transcription factor [Kurthia sibirica]PWI25090.1 DNA-binding response regulator [Kurthia sibirica]GEK34010.1 DNA-binding response regulator [Kurthia sibirica]
MTTLLIVDDDDNIRELLQLFLSAEGYQIIQAENGVVALEKLDIQKIDAAIIDVMMPEMDGWELVEAIRSYSDIPLLMLTAKGETAQKVRGFSLGIDDYLTKPFEPIEVVMRIKALLKRYKIASSQQVTVGYLTLDHHSNSIQLGNNTIQIPQKEFELLFKFASYPNKTFSRAQLIEDIWGYDYEGDERTIDVHIKRLRERFSEAQVGFKIATIWRLGYRLEFTPNEK